MNIYIGYRRVSSTEQLNGGGMDRQQISINRYVELQGGKVSYWYDDDISGTKELRPSLDRMLIEMKELQRLGTVHVIIDVQDRLARDLMVQEVTVMKFVTLGVKCIASDTGIDLCVSTPSNKLIRQMMGAFAEFDKDMIVAKLKAGRESKRRRLIAAGKKGKVEGRKGYEERCPNLHEDCLWLYTHVRRDMRKYGGFGYGFMTKVLSDYGYRNLSGGPLTRSTIVTIIRTSGVKNG